LESTVTAGIVSATGRNIEGAEQFQHFIQTDAAINRGNSGGPLLNIRGEVIGINTMIATESGGSQGVGFALPVNMAVRVYNDIIRDGRDVMLSVRGLWFRPGDTIEACAEDWTRRLGRTREIGHRLSRYLEVRYEALVTSPEATLATICGFLDLVFEPAMLRYHERAGSRLEEHEARYAADGRLVISKAERRHNQRFVMKPPQPDRIGRWRQEATADELRRFESVAGEWLDRLGYVRGS